MTTIVWWEPCVRRRSRDFRRTSGDPPLPTRTDAPTLRSPSASLHYDRLARDRRISAGSSSSGTSTAVGTAPQSISGCRSDAQFARQRALRSHAGVPKRVSGLVRLFTTAPMMANVVGDHGVGSPGNRSPRSSARVCRQRVSAKSDSARPTKSRRGRRGEDRCPLGPSRNLAPPRIPRREALADRPRMVPCRSRISRAQQCESTPVAPVLSGILSRSHTPIAVHLHASRPYIPSSRAIVAESDITSHRHVLVSTDLDSRFRRNKKRFNSSAELHESLLRCVDSTNSCVEPNQGVSRFPKVVHPIPESTLVNQSTDSVTRSDPFEAACSIPSKPREDAAFIKRSLGISGTLCRAGKRAQHV